MWFCIRKQLMSVLPRSSLLDSWSPMSETDIVMLQSTRDKPEVQCQKLKGLTLDLQTLWNDKITTMHNNNAPQYGWHN